MKRFSFFAMLSRMKYIRRWGLMRNAREENLSEHSLDTAYIAHALALLSDVDPSRAVFCALYHDCSEILTGDMPTPVKYYSPQIKESYKEIEQAAAGRLYMDSERRQNLSEDDLMDLARKYDPNNMSREQYDQFLEDMARMAGSTCIHTGTRPLKEVVTMVKKMPRITVIKTACETARLADFC